MKEQLNKALAALGIPVSITAIILAVLYTIGIDPEQIALIASGLVGIPALVFLLIDILKWAGVIDDGIAGVLSACFHLIIYAALVVQFKLYPSFDVFTMDAKVLEFAKMAGVVFAYMTSLINAKRFHAFTVNSIGIKAFSLSNAE